MLARCISLSLVLALLGCTTLQPVAGSAPELRQQIAAGQLLRRGDRVVITTADGRRHHLVVVAADSVSVRGRQESVPTDQIEVVQKSAFSAARTAELALFIGVVAYAAAELVVAPAAIFASTH
ncbi:MAG TPA: hypothetical protein VNX02_12500 [Steroidobacteraceae bacterium]|nr:hypothetical protein [Steroidobacteraceae bacterium]